MPCGIWAVYCRTSAGTAKRPSTIGGSCRSHRTRPWDTLSWRKSACGTDQIEESRRHCEAALNLRSTSTEILERAGRLYAEMECLDKAKRCFRTLADTAGDEPVWELLTLELCPTVFPDADAVTEYRNDLEYHLDEALLRNVSFDWREACRKGILPNFNLVHHGVSNRV